MRKPSFKELTDYSLPREDYELVHRKYNGSGRSGAEELVYHRLSDDTYWYSYNLYERETPRVYQVKPKVIEKTIYVPV